MSKRRPGSRPPSKPSRIPGALVVAAGAVLVCGAALFFRRASPIQAKLPAYTPHPKGSLTFNKDVAPIIFEQCSICHRPGQAAPFELLAYEDVRKRAKQIVEVTERRIMPPWLPEPSYGHFVGERRLSTEQLGIIRQWAAEGAPEGRPGDLPKAPAWPDGWLLGKPDFVATMPEPYVLAADGQDVYRNFVVPLAVAENRYVRAVEFNPQNFKVVHHAFIKFDRTHESRRLDAQDVEPGFPGMSTPAEMPEGQFLTWQPGHVTIPAGVDFAWRLEKGSDLVLQMHLRPSGKPETVQPSVAFYFSDKPPTRKTFKICLTSLTIDIPAGEPLYVVEDQFVLPSDADLTAILPHAHFLARQMEGWVTFPSGEKQPLLRIDHWDFNWQGEYRYAEPIRLPSGSILSMRFTYDNSTNNLANPHSPPQRVFYGPQTTDEMAELWFQLALPVNADISALERARDTKNTRLFAQKYRQALRLNPNDAQAHAQLGLTLFGQGHNQEAQDHLRTAIALQPDLSDAHYYLGLVCRAQKKYREAEAEFESTTRLDPANYKAYGNLGFIYLEQGDLLRAETQFRAALAINPGDSLAAQALAEISSARAGPRK